jgi:8-oxo-dGTP pyrophosphatase MutT (NUDIX family)
MTWKRKVEPFVRPLVQALARTTRGLTLGVRGMVFDEAGRVLLIEHTYTHGWHLPGGGVEKNETAEASLARELVEEAGVRIEGRPSLHGVYSSGRHFPGDHVLIYVVRDWSACEMTSRGEIHAVEWFAPDALPELITPGTRRRIEEALGARPIGVFW